MGAASADTAAPWQALDVATSARRLATDLEFMDLSCEPEPGWRTHPPVAIPTAVSGL